MHDVLRELHAVHTVRRIGRHTAGSQEKRRDMRPFFTQSHCKRKNTGGLKYLRIMYEGSMYFTFTGTLTDLKYDWMLWVKKGPA